MMQKQARRAYKLILLAALCTAALPVHASPQESASVEEKLRLQQQMALECLRPQAFVNSTFLQQQFRMSGFFDAGKEALPAAGRKAVKQVNWLPVMRAAYVLGEGSQICRAMFSLSALLQRLLNKGAPVEKFIQQAHEATVGLLIISRIDHSPSLPNQAKTDRIVDCGALRKHKQLLRYHVWRNSAFRAYASLIRPVFVFRWSLFWVSWLQLRGPPTR